jgi:hypothetical protein
MTTRGKIPVGAGWDRPLHSDRVGRVEAGEDTSVQGLGLNLGLGEQPSDRIRNRVQSLGVSSVRKRAPNFPEGLPPLSD